MDNEEAELPVISRRALRSYECRTQRGLRDVLLDRPHHTCGEPPNTRGEQRQQTPTGARHDLQRRTGVYIRGEFGVRLEDDMIITESGAELMTPQSRSLEAPFGS